MLSVISVSFFIFLPLFLSTFLPPPSLLLLLHRRALGLWRIPPTSLHCPGEAAVVLCHRALLPKPPHPVTPTNENTAVLNPDVILSRCTTRPTSFFTMQPWMTLNSWSFHPHSPGAGLKGTCQHTLSVQRLGPNVGLCVCQAGSLPNELHPRPFPVPVSFYSVNERDSGVYFCKVVNGT